MLEALALPMWCVKMISDSGDVGASENPVWYVLISLKLWFQWGKMIDHRIFSLDFQTDPYDVIWDLLWPFIGLEVPACSSWQQCFSGHGGIFACKPSG
jgi:hypothetical protein